ncbi:MAG TPA: DUF5668 domain-containing protein [Acidobacteriota bacterium]
MKCFYHPTEDSVHSCSTCNRLLCAACSHSIKGSIYCQDCLVQGAEFARLALAAGPDLVKPKRAAVFAVVPGMGAVYNRQYNKALVHFATFALLMLIADQGPDVFGFAAFSFWVFTIIDAYRSAQEILRHRLTEPVSEPHEKPLNAPLWGGALILLGSLFFISNLGLISFDFLRRFWPLAFVFLGLYLIYDHYRKQKEASSTTAAPVRTGQPSAQHKEI